MPGNGYVTKVRVLDKYKVIGFISSGTYGRVYKAVGSDGQGGEFAIKKYTSTVLWSNKIQSNGTAGSSQTRKAN